TPYAFAVYLTWPGGSRPGTGIYELSISLDGTAHHCTIAAPDVACTDSSATGCRCKVEQCDLGPFGRVECAPPGGSLGFIAFQDTRLSHIMVSVSQGGRVVGTGNYHPVYQMREINGPGCGTCPVAEKQQDVLILNP